jgi:hypothetical protein
MDLVEQNRQFEKLPYAKGAAYNSKDNQHERCLENTRVDLLREIQKWATDPYGKDVFWMSGRAGTGKSTIARTVAYELAKQGCLGASFFFRVAKRIAVMPNCFSLPLQFSSWSCTPLSNLIFAQQ